MDKRLNMKESLDYKLYCQRSVPIQRDDMDREYDRILDFHVNRHLSIDREIDEVDIEISKMEVYDRDRQKDIDEDDDGDENAVLKKKKKQELAAKKKAMKSWDVKKKELSKLKEERQQIIAKYFEAISELKELQFIDEVGMDRSMALQLDIPMRKRLEEMFPELRSFYVLCFRPDSSIQRRAFVYHKRENEKDYMEVMKTYLQQYNLQFHDRLNSAVKISFRGKYIVKVNSDLYRKFQTTIKLILDGKRVKHTVIETTLKFELHLRGNEESPRAVQDAYEEIVDLLRAEEFYYKVSDDGKGQKDLYNYYALFSLRGDDLIQQYNNQFNSTLLIEPRLRQRKVIIRGIEKDKEWIVKELRNLINNFNGYVHTKEYKLSSAQAFLRERKQIEEIAKSKDLSISYKSSDRDILRICWNNFDPQSRINYNSSKSDKVDSFIKILDMMLTQSETEMIKSRRREGILYLILETKEICTLCNRPVWDKFRLLYCSHVFCSPCAKSYLEEQSSCTEFKCPIYTCDSSIALYDIINLFSQVELEEVFAQLKVDFLDQNRKRFKYCPTPNCENILEKTGDNLMMFCTVCGYVSCFECRKSHFGTECASKKVNRRMRVSLFNSGEG